MRLSSLKRGPIPFRSHAASRTASVQPNVDQIPVPVRQRSGGSEASKIALTNEPGSGALLAALPPWLTAAASNGGFDAA
jgi:hypothetical protein